MMSFPVIWSLAQLPGRAIVSYLLLIVVFHVLFHVYSLNFVISLGSDDSESCCANYFVSGLVV